MSERHFLPYFALFFLYGLLVLLLFPSAQALELSGQKLSPIIYEPGKSITNHYEISGTDKQVEVTLSVDVAVQKFISLSEVTNNAFDLMIAFPENYIPSGSYSFSLRVTEVQSQEEVDAGGVGSLLSVSKLFEIVVYAQDTFLEASLSAPDVNVGSPVHFQVRLVSKGYVAITEAGAQITVVDHTNQSVATLSTQKRALPALGTALLSAQFNTTGLSSGAYRASALVSYDGKTASAEAPFQIGALELLLLNHTLALEPGFNEFQLRVKNNWGNTLKNVYARVFLQEQEVLQTAPSTLAPWQEQAWEGLVKVELPPGIYPGRVRLFYEEKEKEIPITLEVRQLALVGKAAEPVETQQNSLFSFSLLALLLAVILLLVSVVVYLLRKRKRENF